MKDPTSTVRRRGSTAPLLMLVGLSLATAGCRTFNYTDEDMARERNLIAERVAGGRCFWACVGNDPDRDGYGSVGNFHLDLGKFHCPSPAEGGVCRGK